jgi:hypothetical protein
MAALIDLCRTRDCNLENCEECRKSEPLWRRGGSVDQQLLPEPKQLNYTNNLVANMFQLTLYAVGMSLSVPFPLDRPFIAHPASWPRKCVPIVISHLLHFPTLYPLWNVLLAGRGALPWNIQSNKICDDYHLLGDDNHHSHRRGNLKSYNKICVPFSNYGVCTCPYFPFSVLTSGLIGLQWSLRNPQIHWKLQLEEQLCCCVPFISLAAKFHASPYRMPHLYDAFNQSVWIWKSR